MPLYTVSTRESLPTETKQKIVDAITEQHCMITEAIPEFVQVFFSEGVPLNKKVDLHLFGSIRSGRTEETKSRMNVAFRHALAQILGSEANRLQCVLSDVPASWVMEGGKILPEPGQEEEWLATMS